MKTILHAFAGGLALFMLIIFLLAILFAEVEYEPQDIISIQQTIFQAMGFYLLLIAIAGGIGFLLSKERSGRIVEMKKKRMLAIIAISVLILFPINFALANYDLAANGMVFMYTLEGVESTAIILLVALLGFNFRDGTRLTAIPPSLPSSS